MLTVPGDLKVQVSPNPVQSNLSIVVNTKQTGKTDITIYNFHGSKLLQKNVVKSSPGIMTESINLSRLPTGIYIMKVTVGAHYVKTVRIVKQ